MTKGRVLDYFTETPVSGVDVFVLGNVTSGVLASGTTTSSGTFNFTTISGSDDFLTFYPSLSGYVGYSRFVERYLDNIDLYVKPKTYISTISSFEFFDSPLKTSWNVNKLTTTPCELFALTDNGFDVIDSNTLQNVCSTVISGGVNTLGIFRQQCDDQLLYFTVPSSGVYSYTLSGSYNLNNILDEATLTYEGPTSLLSNNVILLDKNESNDLAIVSDSGIDYYDGALSTRSFSQFTTPVDSIQVSTSGDLYYSPSGSGIYVKYKPTSNWTSEDYFLNSTTTPALSGNVVNDLEVLNTPSGYTLFLATNSGVSIIDENRSNISSSNIKYLGSSVISGAILNVSSIEVPPGTTTSSGSIFISTYDTVTKDGIVQEIDLSTDTVVNTFTESITDLRLRRSGLPISGSKTIALR